MRPVTKWGTPWLNKHRKDGCCARCGNPVDRELHHGKRRQRYCRKCHAAYMRATRPRYSEMTKEQQRRSNCRAHANVALRRGQIHRQPCEDCQNPKAQMHHDNYRKPLEIRWKCRGCHIAHHAD